MDQITLADKGYVGLGILTPTKRKPGVKTLKAVKDNNRVVKRLRVVVERVIAQIKTWRIFHGFPAAVECLWAGVFGGAWGGVLCGWQDF